MARAARKKELTAEERLEAALVPEGEQPYEVPGNWCWVRLKSIAKWGSGGTPSRKMPEYYTGEVPWIKTGELNDGYIYETEEHITEEAIENSSAKLFPVNTVVIAMYGATIGKVGILGVEAATNQACACGVCTEAIIYKFLFHYACSQKDAFVNKSKGGAQPNISQDIIKNHPIPIPPLAEQQRIVNLIEGLFADLDEAKEKLSAVLEGFAQRKAAILHQAFTGELTAKWREENGIDSQWELVNIASVCHSLKYGTSKKSSPEGKIAVLRMGNLQKGEISWTNLVYSNDEEDNEKYKLLPGDVLFNRTNSAELVGKTSIYRGELPAIYAGYLIKLDYDHDRLIGDYLNYVLNSPKANEYCNEVKTDGVNQSNINAKKIGAFSFNLPSMAEQREIVRILDHLFEDEQQAQASVEGVLEDIDTIKKSILARAFRGELGTNEPGEESAMEMLKPKIPLDF